MPTSGLRLLSLSGYNIPDTGTPPADNALRLQDKFQPFSLRRCRRTDGQTGDVLLGWNDRSFNRLYTDALLSFTNTTQLCAYKTVNGKF